MLHLTCCTQSQAAVARMEAQCSHSQKVLVEELQRWVLLSTLAGADLEDRTVKYIMNNIFCSICYRTEILKIKIKHTGQDRSNTVLVQPLHYFL